MVIPRQLLTDCDLSGEVLRYQVLYGRRRAQILEV